MLVSQPALYVKITCMQNDAIKLPHSKTGLIDLVREQQVALTHRDKKLEQQSQFIEQLLEQIRLARHQHFGTRSERFNIDQMALVFNEAEALLEQPLKEDGVTSSGQKLDSDDVAVPAHKRSRGGRRPLPAELPRVEIVHTLDDDECCCSYCNEAMEPISEKTSEQLDIIPAQVQVIRHVRRTYACKTCDSTPQTASLPPQPIPKSIASPGTLAHVAVAKYVDALPLYRQEQQLKRINIDLPRSTLASWMIKAGLLVQPLINVMRDTMLAYDILAMDETTLQVLNELGKSAQSRSYFWAQRGGPPEHPIVLYDYDPSRASSVPVKLIGNFKGYLQTDGYDGYNAACQNNGLIQLGCWAHARRKFDEALKAQKLKTKNKSMSLAADAMRRIQLLYQIERKAKNSTAQQRYDMRQQRSLQELNDFRKWLDKHLMIVPPKSALGKAMNYADKQWPKLTTYTLDGRLKIDNNLTENSIRPFVVGRKNWLFCNSVAGAKASANLYSLIETAKANNIEPYRYLRRVFTELPKATSHEDVEALLPFKTKSTYDETS